MDNTLKRRVFIHYNTKFSSINFDRADLLDNVSTRKQNRNRKVLKQFLYDLVQSIGMTVFMPPVAKLSKGVNDAWTVFVGLYESGIIMHLYPLEGGRMQLEIQISSCKNMTTKQLASTQRFVESFWQMQEYKLTTESDHPNKSVTNRKEEIITVK